MRADFESHPSTRARFVFWGRRFGLVGGQLDLTFVSTSKETQKRRAMQRFFEKERTQKQEDREQQVISELEREWEKRCKERTGRFVRARDEQACVRGHDGSRKRDSRRQVYRTAKARRSGQSGRGISS